MAQITIYLDDELLQKVKQSAASSHMSQSQWIANLIRERTHDRWPESIKQLAGSWQDLPDIETLRSDYGVDIERESL